MNRTFKHLANLAILVTVGFMAGCSTPAPAPNPSMPLPPVQQPPTNPQYNYTHRQTINQSTMPPTSRPVVALLRVGDIGDLGDTLPWGRKLEMRAEPDAPTTNPSDAPPVGRTRIVQGQDELEVLLPRHVREELVNCMVNSQRVVVVERERILELVRELQGGQSEAEDPATSPRRGRLLGVHYVIEATFFPAGSEGAREAAKGAVGWAASQDPDSQCAIYLKVYDVETAVIVATELGLSPNSSDAVQMAVNGVMGKLQSKTIRVVSFDPNGNPILDRGAVSGIKEGDHFVTNTDGKEVTMSVKKVDPLSCIAEILGPATERPKIGDQTSLVMNGSDDTGSAR